MRRAEAFVTSVQTQMRLVEAFGTLPKFQMLLLEAFVTSVQKQMRLADAFGTLPTIQIRLL